MRNPNSLLGLATLILCICSLPFGSSISAQTSTCTSGSVSNGNGDAWSPECYLNNSCGLSGNPCQANDVNVLGAFIADINGAPIVPCNLGSTVQGYLWATFANGSGSDRYAVRVYGEVLINGSFSGTTINTCAFDAIANGAVQDRLLFGPLNWTCGDALALRNLWIAWDTDAGSTCATATTCGDYPPSKCFKNIDLVGVEILVPNFDVDCGQTNLELCFSDMTMGGAPYTQGGMTPYTYHWDFGDGSSSSQQNPCHTFADNGPYTIQLDITDSVGVTASVLRAIRLDTFDCCDLTVTCPSPSTFNLTCNDAMPDCTDTEDEFEALTGANIENPCSTVVITCDDNGSICAGQIIRIITIDDGSTMETCTLTFNFSQPPLSTTCPAGGDLACNPAASAYAADDAPTWTGGCNVVNTGIIAGTPTNDGCNYTVTHKYWATDACGTTDTCYQTFTWIQDNAAPTNNDCDAGSDLGCNPAASAYAADDFPNWSDACNFSSGVIAGTPTNNGCNYTVTHKYWATDQCLNSDTCYQTFTWIQDNAAPTNNNCDAGSNLGCNPAASAYAADDFPNWSDACNFSSGVIAGTPTNNGCNYTVTHKYWATDQCLNSDTCYQTFTWIQDNAAPTNSNCDAGSDLGCNPAASAYAADDFPNWSDACNFSSGVIAGTPTNNGCNYTVTHKYWATDQCLNSDTCYQTFTWIQDNAAPTNNNCDAGSDLGCNPAASAYAADDFPNWSDACNFSSGVIAGTPTNNGCNYTVTHKYWATDQCLNSDTCYQTFTWIQDNAAPTNNNCDAGSDLGCNPAASAYAADDFPNWSDACNFSSGVIAGTPSNNGCNYTVTHEYWATDQCLNSDTCYQTFTWIQDNAAPTNSNCDAGSDLGCNPAASAYAADDFPNWSDACNFSSGVIAGTPTNDGCNYTVTHKYWATDQCLNTDTCYQTFTWVEDNAAPTNSNCDAGSDLGCNPAASAYAADDFPNWSDACNFSSGVIAGTPTNNGCNYTVTHKYWATDQCLNSDTCYQTFTWIQDNAAPTNNNCDAGSDLGCNPAASAYAADDFPNWSDACNFSSGVIAGTPTNDGCNYTVTHKYWATDQCLNTDTCYQTFTWVEDNAAPTNNNCDTGSDLGCNPAASAYAADDFPNWSDACNFSSGVIAGTPTNDGCNYTVTHKYWATDQCLNTDTCYQTFTWVEDIDLSLSCPADTLVDEDQSQADVDQAFEDWKDRFDHSGTCDATVTYKVNEVEIDLDTLSAPDACGGDITVEMVVESPCASDSCESSFIVIATVEGLLLALPGMQSSCSNAPQPPTLADLPAVRSDEQIISAFLLVSACVDMDQLSVNHIESGPTVMNGNEYMFERTYFVEGPNNLATEATEEFMILYDPDAPILSGLPEDLVLPCGSAIPAMPTVTAYDVVFGDVQVTASSQQIPSGCGGYMVRRTWTARDGCGNVMQGVQNITFEDNEDPILSVPPDTVLECSEIVPAPDYSVSDACSEVFVAFAESISGDPDCEHSIIRTWTATDGCGNSVSKSQTIEIVDTEGPVITVVNPMLADVPNGGEIVMYNCDNPQVAMADIEVSDCCDFTVELSDQLIASSVCDIFGYYRKWICSYVATDQAGNVSEHAFYVIQYDTTAPTLHHVPGYLEVACDSLIPPPDSTVYGEDDCLLSTTPDFEEDTIRDPSDDSKFALIRTWSMEDRCGNRTEASQVVSVCGFDTTLITSGLGNTVWIDSNENGLQDAGEQGLNDVTVYLYCPEDELGFVRIDSTVTRRSDGQDGQFFFDHLMPDDYQLLFALPEGWKFTMSHQGSNEHVDSDADELTGMTEVITLGHFDKLNSIDAGLVQLAALPVELSDFTVSAEGCNARLTWSTLSEHGADRFEIQRSVDGITFETIGKVPASGASSEAIGYEYVDELAHFQNFYRLRIVDVDGTTEYSDLRSMQLSCRRKHSHIVVYPNPSVGNFVLDFEVAQWGHLDLRLYNMLGQLIYHRTDQVDAGRFREQLDLSGQPNGIYILQTRIGDQVNTHTLIKEQ